MLLRCMGILQGYYLFVLQWNLWVPAEISPALHQALYRYVCWSFQKILMRSNPQIPLKFGLLTLITELVRDSLCSK